MKLKVYLICFLCFAQLIWHQVYGQGLCNIGGGGFEVSVSEGCAPLAVQLTNNVQGAFLIQYQFLYDGRAEPVTAPRSEYTYVSPGSYTILQYGSTTTGLFSACKNVKVYESRAPNAEYRSCGAGTVIFSLTDDAILNVYDQVEINWGDNSSLIWKKGDALVLEHIYSNTSSGPKITVKGTYTSNNACSGGEVRILPVVFEQPQLGTIRIKSVEMKSTGSVELYYIGVTAIQTEIQYSADGVNNYTVAAKRASGGSNIFYRINGLNSNQIYDLRLSSTDLCGGHLDSDIVKTMVVSGRSAEEKNILSWNKYPDGKNFTEYELFRDGVSLKKFAINETSYTDEDVQCGDEFEYYIVAKTQLITSISAPIVVKTEIAQPKPITQAIVSVNSDKLIVINAVIPGAGPKSNYELTIERANAGTTEFKKIATIQNQSEFSDISVNANELSYCYRLSYENSCGQKLPPTEPICSILLVNKGFGFVWTTEKPFLENVSSYDVLQVGNTSGLNTINNQLVNTFRPKFNAQSDLEYTFQIQALSESGNFQSYSNTVSYTRNAGVFVPDAFSPNGDGTNDTLVAISSRLQSFNISIFNRWGQVVYHSDDILKGWDGKINGANAPVGAYVYKVKFVDDIDQKVEKSGTFMLLR